VVNIRGGGKEAAKIKGNREVLTSLCSRGVRRTARKRKGERNLGGLAERKREKLQCEAQGPGRGGRKTNNSLEKETTGTSTNGTPTKFYTSPV